MPIIDCGKGHVYDTGAYASCPYCVQQTPQDPYAQQQSYAPQDPYAQQQPYAPQNPYAQQQPYAPQDPYAQQQPYAPQDPYAQQQQPYAPQDPYAQQQAYAPQAVGMQPAAGPPPAPQKNPRKPLIIALSAVCALLVIGVVLYAVLSGGPSAPPVQTGSPGGNNPGLAIQPPTQPTQPTATAEPVNTTAPPEDPELLFYTNTTVPDLGALLNIDVVDVEGSTSTYYAYYYATADVSMTDVSLYQQVLGDCGFSSVTDQRVIEIMPDSDWYDDGIMYVAMGVEQSGSGPSEDDRFFVFIISCGTLNEQIGNVTPQDPETLMALVKLSVGTRIGEDNYELVEVGYSFETEGQLEIKINEVATYYGSGKKLILAWVDLTNLSGNKNLAVQNYDFLLIGGKGDVVRDDMYYFPASAMDDYGNDAVFPLSFGGQGTMGLALVFDVSADTDNFALVFTNMPDLEAAGPVYVFPYDDDNIYDEGAD